jgi:ssDNA-binding Zn-finger/Zn-ribbon topoisomerase 1
MIIKPENCPNCGKEMLYHIQVYGKHERISYICDICDCSDQVLTPCVENKTHIKEKINITYTTTDGNEFNNKEEAERHQTYLNTELENQKANELKKANILKLLDVKYDENGKYNIYVSESWNKFGGGLIFTANKNISFEDFCLIFEPIWGYGVSVVERLFNEMKDGVRYVYQHFYDDYDNDYDEYRTKEEYLKTYLSIHEQTLKALNEM